MAINIAVEADNDGNVTFRLSNYAAWAIVRRLKGEDAADETEGSFVREAAERLEDALSE